MATKFIRLSCTSLAVGYCVTRFVAEPVLLAGPSMEPTMKDNDIIIADKFSSTFRKNDYRRGDIIIARSPYDPKIFICKRIAGTPGDVMRMNMFGKVIPKGHVWVLGDNSDNSTDSRDFGCLPIGLIVGRVMWRVWPLDRVEAFERDSS